MDEIGCLVQERLEEGVVAGQRDEELASGGLAVTPGSSAATPAAIGSFRINPLNR